MISIEGYILERAFLMRNIHKETIFARAISNLAALLAMSAAKIRRYMEVVFPYAVKPETFSGPHIDIPAESSGVWLY